MNILLSIKPKYVEAMAEGKKSYEFRKSIFKNRSIERVFLYSTQPVGKVVGSFKVGRVISDTPRLLWESFGTASGVTYSDFFDYFKSTNLGYAIEIIDLRVFQTPLRPDLYFPGFKPPRSFMYIDGQLSNIDHTQLLPERTVKEKKTQF